MGLHYQDVITSTQAAIDRLIASNCRFLCFVRANGKGEIEPEETLNLSDALRQIVDFVPVLEFRDDISSTQLRGVIQKQYLFCVGFQIKINLEIFSGYHSISER
jgi:hypothetical protein